jgi:hypothetical protein
MLNSNFEIRRRGDGGTISGTLPATALPIGIALMYGSKDADTGENTFILATNKANGFLTRASRVGAGLTDSELAFPASPTGGETLETPFEAGKPGSIEKATELELEGLDYINATGTGAVTSTTVAGTKLSFLNGKVCEAQTGQFAQYRLVKQMTPVNGTASSTYIRIYIEEIEGVLVA